MQEQATELPTNEDPEVPVESPAPEPAAAPEETKPAPATARVPAKTRRGPLSDSPDRWTGTRTVSLNLTCCGPCMDAMVHETESYHEKCRHEVGWYDKLWVCGCECNAGWIPQAVVLEKGAVVGSHTEPLPRPEESPNETYRKNQAARAAKAEKAAKRGRG